MGDTDEGLARMIHVGRNKVAQVVPEQRKRIECGSRTVLRAGRSPATEVPADSAFARSGLQFGE